MVSFRLAMSSINENINMALVPVDLNIATGLTVTVNFAVIAGGTATSPQDFILAAGTLSFVPPARTADIVVTIVDNTTFELAETVIIELSNPVNATLGAITQHTLTINDNDPVPTVAFEMPTLTFTEESGTVMPRVLASNASSQAMSVNVGITGGLATEGEDYSISGFTVNFAAGATTGSYSLTLVDDDIDEFLEDIRLTLLGNVNCVIDPVLDDQTILIDDTDPTPTIMFETAGQNVSEIPSKTGVGLVLSGQSANTVTVEIFTTDGTAVGAEDYAPFKTTVIFDPLSTFGFIPFSTLDDSLVEGTESFTIDISDPFNADLGSPASHLVTILDDEGPPTIQFAFDTSEINENNGDPAQLQVTVTPPVAIDVMVDFAVTGGDATDPDDFTLAAGTLTIPANFTGGTLTVPIVDDLLDELDETIEITLSNPVGVDLGVETVHTLTILDDDGAPLVSFSPLTFSASEDSGAGHVEVVLDAPSGLLVTVEVQVSGGSATDPDDYTLPLGVATFQPGETSFSFPITIVDDDFFEFDEFIQFALANPVNAVLGIQATTFFTIIENEGFPTPFFTLAASDVAEGAGSTMIEVQIAPPAAFDLLVFFELLGGTASSPEDFSLDVFDLNFPAMTNRASLPVTIVDDLEIEGNESADLLVFLGGKRPGDRGAGPGPQDVHTLTILDNEGVPEVSFLFPDSFWFENQGTAFIDVVLSQSFPQDVTVDVVASGGSATEGSDYTIDTPTITIPASKTFASVQVTIIDDTEQEPDETFDLSLANPVNATIGLQGTHVGTIFGNDDPLTVAFTEGASEIDEGNTLSSFFLTLNQFPSPNDVSVDFTVTGGSATNGADFILADGTVNFIKGSTFQIVNYDVLDDTEVEGFETFSVSLSNPFGAELGVPSKHTVIIRDTEPSEPLIPQVYTSTEPPVVNQFTQILGDDWGDFLGGIARGTAVGDFNDDGFDDVAIGAYGADRNGSTINVGELYVVFGGRYLSGVPTLNLNSDGAPIPGVVRFIGETVLDEFGFSVAAGDVNGDRIDDLVVGAWRKTFQGDTFGGRGYIFYGGRDMPTSGVIDITAPGSEPDVVILPRSRKGFLGLGLETADINADGFADVIISAPFGDLNAQTLDTGNAYIIWGHDAVPALINLAVPSAFDGQFFTYTQVLGMEAGGQLGYAIATGDFDADGIEDFALGAPGTVQRLAPTPRLADSRGGPPTITIHGQVFVVGGRTIMRQFDSIDIYNQQQQGGAERGLFVEVWNYINDAPQFTDRQFGNVLAGGDFQPFDADDLAVSLWGNDAGAPAGSIALLTPDFFCCGGVFSLVDLGTDVGPGFGLFELTADNAEALLWGDTLAGGSIEGNGFDELWAGTSDSDVQSIVDAGFGRVLRTDEFVFDASGTAALDALNAYAIGRGLSTGEAFARSSAANADINGDGFGEMLLGVPFFDNPTIPDLPPGQPDPRNNDGGAGFILWGRPTALDPIPTGRDHVVVGFGQPKFAKMSPEVRAWFETFGFSDEDTRGKTSRVEMLYIRGEDPIPPDKSGLIPVPGVWIAAGFVIDNGMDIYLRYGDADAAALNLDESTLEVFFDNGHGVWLPLPSQADPFNNTVKTFIDINGLKLGLMGLERTTGFTGVMIE